MDALAAYGSDSDDSGTESMPTPTPPAKTTPSIGSTSKASGLSSMLPPPKSSPASVAASTVPSSSSSLPKVGKYSTMPTLDSDPDSDEEEESPFRKKARLAAAAKAGSGTGVGALFAMLPTPKNTSAKSAAASSSGSGPAKATFMPRTVAKKPAAVVKTPAAKVTDEADEPLAEEDNDEDDEDNEGPVSFFPMGAAVTSTHSTTGSSGKAASNSYIPLFFDKKPLTTEEQEAQSGKLVDVSMTNEQYAYPSSDQYAYPSNDQYAYPSNDQYAYPTNDQYAYPTNDQYAYPTSNEAYAYDPSSSSAQSSSQQGNGGRGPNTIQLDNDGLQKLGMRKARDAPIHVIDVFAKDQMSQAQHVRHAMAGSGSQPKPVDLASISHLKPSTQQKRKHNIMSLAYEAKANAAQLNASWAASRQTKAETQSKYGF
ncbi:proline-rich protein PRCC [Entomortierella parvispora]|uniref:Proline-rich protein PRCC n=1 Tax=Entomortierella parvispora TaxID=205924 RepID=A0A9P3LSQ6_9FUNG|nr:proline-rich protein PRCC [Entomortierella parvispora]